MNAIEIFAVILVVSIVAATIIACVTKDHEVLWFPLLVIIFYLSCGGQAGIFRNQDTAEKSAIQVEKNK